MKTQRGPREEIKARKNQKKMIPEGEDSWKQQRPPPRKATVKQFDKNRGDSLELFESDEESDVIVGMPGKGGAYKEREAPIGRYSMHQRIKPKQEGWQSGRDLLSVPMKGFAVDESSLNENESDMDIRDALSHGGESDIAKTLKRRHGKSTTGLPAVSNHDGNSMWGDKRGPSQNKRGGGNVSTAGGSNLV